jgi:hypothetical protein
VHVWLKTPHGIVRVQRSDVQIRDSVLDQPRVESAEPQLWVKLRGWSDQDPTMRPGEWYRVIPTNPDQTSDGAPTQPGYLWVETPVGPRSVSVDRLEFREGT